MSVPLARRFIVEQSMEWGHPRVMRLAMVLASELVSNAVHQGHAPVVLRLICAGPYVRLEVEDGCTDPPAVGKPDPDDEAGRGVYLVAELSRKWGCDVLPNGKRVWCEVGAGQPAVR